MGKGFRLALLLVCALSARGADIRIVNGKEVDISPVVKWFRESKGERPMPHWKQLQFGSDSVSGRAAGGIKCDLLADGERKTIILANPPRFILAMIEQHELAIKRLDALDALIADRERRIRALNQQADLAYGDAYDIIAANRTAFRNQITEAEIEQTKLRATIRLTGKAEDWREFAMFTGRTVGPIEIWDCGRKKP